MTCRQMRSLCDAFPTIARWMLELQQEVRTISDMSSTSWAQDQTERIAKEIRRLRGTSSAQWLSDRTAEVGHRIGRSTISEIETGRRQSLSVVELTIIARALDVPPAQLLYPDLPDGPVEVLPGEHVTSIDAVRWFSGEITLEPEVGLGENAAAGGEAHERFVRAVQISRGARLLRLSRQRANLHDELAALLRTSETRDESVSKLLAPEVIRTQKQIESVESEIRHVEGAVVGPA